MKLLVGLGGSGLLLGGLYAGDTLSSGRVYDIPMEQAFSELSSMPVPDALIPATAGADATVAVRQSAQAINWHFQVRGQEVGVFTARLASEGAGRTRVRIHYAPGEPLPPELRHLTSATLTRDLARIAMSEQVEAQLERRPVDQDEIADALARHAAAHPEQVREFQLGMAEMAAGLHRQANENSSQIPGPPEGYRQATTEAEPGAWGPAPANH